MGKDRRRNSLGTKRTITGIPAFTFFFLSILTKYISPINSGKKILRNPKIPFS
jgi:hypothetical protein